jgi:hypothetical protein
MKGRCQIVAIVVRASAKTIVDEFLAGWSIRKLSLHYGLSYAGVEELIRSYGLRLRNRRTRARIEKKLEAAA